MGSKSSKRWAPERVRLLVLVGAKAAHRPEPEFRDAAVRLLANEDMAGGWPTYWGPLFAPTADRNAVEAARKIAFDQDIDDVILGVRVFHSRPDRSDFVQGWGGPILVINGEHDRQLRNGAELAASVPNGTFRYIRGAGHYVSFERPGEVTAILGEAIDNITNEP